MPPILQISIPTTSTVTASDGGKAYTVYHVTLQLPLRKDEVKKRYNDFVALNDALVAQTGSAPPQPLPPKSWLRRTVNSEALTEERRQGLEKYVRAIVEAEDKRWRTTGAWRSFLGVPGADTEGKKAEGAGKGITDPSEWLDVHRTLKSQMQNARQLLSQREAATTAQNQHALSADAKAALVRAATGIAQLEDGLRSWKNAGGNGGWGGSTLGEGELRRRKDLLASARKEVEGLEGVLKSLPSTRNPSASGTSTPSNTAAAATCSDKAALWNGTSAAKTGRRVLGGPQQPLKETERTRELDNSGLLQLQRQVMEEQEEDVLTLGKSVARMKEMGILMGEELEIQNQMLNLVEEDVGRVQGKIDVGRRMIGRIK
jgi:regulator of vacuolar morphogenesis